MHRIIHLWLEPTPAQTTALLQTVELVNAARNAIKAVAYCMGTVTTRALFEACAEEIRSDTGLSPAMTHRAIASVAAAYRTQRRVQQRYQAHQSVPYDRHTLRIDTHEQAVTIWTVSGWQVIAFATEAPSVDGWTHPTLMLLRDRWALLLVVPDREGEPEQEGQ